MRYDDDPFGRYVPLLRRVIIFVAVLAAIPVVLWTITVAVRSYVATPRAPTYRSAALPAPTQGADGVARPEPMTRPPAATVSPSTTPDTVSAIVEARATTMDARGVSPAVKGPNATDRTADSDLTAQPDTPPRTEAVTPAMSATPTTPGDADPKIPDVWSRPAAPSGAAPLLGVRAAQQQPPATTTDWPAEATPASPPLTGPIPLPRRRPTLLAMAQQGIPMPRPRPGGSAAAAPEPENNGPVEWLRNLLH